jgi:hypothetical protein
MPCHHEAPDPLIHGRHNPTMPLSWTRRTISPLEKAVILYRMSDDRYLDRKVVASHALNSMSVPHAVACG